MSSVAQILHARGKKVSGSDQAPSQITSKLMEQGIAITNQQIADNITSEIDLVVYSNAIPAENPELLQAKAQDITTISHSEALGEITATMRTIAVCGTHGKSTTTAMLAKAALACDTDPTVMIGTIMKEFNYNNVRIGQDDLLIIEACEYKRAFLNIHPDIIIITNLEPDHLDYFKDTADYENAFQEFANLLPSTGTIIINQDDPGSQNLQLNLTQKVKTFSTNQAPAELNLQVPGKHNLSNALAALAAIETLNLNQSKAITGLNDFHGTWRRFEYKGKLGKTTIIDDYAHHPTEIKATLAAAREKFGPDAKICAVFQPHQYNRTHNLIDEFATSFSEANQIIIPNIYSVRDTESDRKKISTDSLVTKIAEHHSSVSNGQGIKNTTAYLKENHQQWDAIIIMGAGDITTIHQGLLN